MSIAGADGLILVQFDIKTAYLNSTIREVIFMDLPFGFEDWFHKHFPESRGKVCRILKGLYGLKQSARSWNSTFSAFLKAYDLLQSTADACVFVSTTTPRLVLALWVDDGLAMCQDQALLTKMIAHLQTAFEVTVGDADVYVGIHITKDIAAWWIYIDQQRFTDHWRIPCPVPVTPMFLRVIHLQGILILLFLFFHTKKLLVHCFTWLLIRVQILLMQSL